MMTRTEHATRGLSQRDGSGGVLWFATAMATLLAIWLASAPALSAQKVDIQAPGVTIKATESGEAEIEAPGVSIKVTPPEVQQTQEGETIDLSGPWKFKGDWLEGGLAEGWYRQDFDDADWRGLHVPGSWESQGVNSPNPRWPVKTEECGYNGFAWYRRDFSVPENWREGRVLLRIGRIYDEDWTYVNGQSVGQMTGADVWDQQREYLIPPDVLKPGEDNVIAIRVFDSVRDGGLAEGPVELVNTSAAVEGASAPPETRDFTTTHGDIVRFGSSVTIPAGEKVLGDVVVVGGSVEVSGYVTGDVMAVGGSVRVFEDGRIDGDAGAVGGKVHQEEGATIGGDIIETGVGLSLPSSWFGKDRPEHWRHGPRGPFLGMGLLGGILVWGFLTLLAALLFRQRLETMAAALPVHPGRAALYGVAGLLLTPAAIVAEVLVGAFVTVLLVITLVGILAIPAVWAAVAALLIGWVLLLFSGVVAVWLGIGRGLAAALKRPDLHPIWAALIGLVLVGIAVQLPVVGGLVIATLIVFGFGLAVMTGFGSDPEWAHRRLGWRTSGPSPQAPRASGPEAPGLTEGMEDDTTSQEEEEIETPPSEEGVSSLTSTEAGVEAEQQPSAGETDEIEGASQAATEATREDEENRPEP